MTQKRAAFFVSDRTGITAEMLGHSLLTQFDKVGFNEITLPFVDSIEKAQDVVNQINRQAEDDGVRPLVISTLARTEIAAVVGRANALFLDCFEMFIGPLERELGVDASHVMGRSHAVSDLVNYYRRIEAVNYTIAHDDGLAKRDLGEADIILVGVSRSGKTPTSLYLAMQFGIRAANYPLTPDDFPTMKLPSEIQQFRGRLYGLTIAPKRLEEIRTERVKHMSNDRRFGKNYANLANCEYEIHRAEALMQQENIPFLDATSKSVEELATTILHVAKLQRRIY